MTQAPQGNYNPPAHNWAAGHQKKSDATVWVLPMIIGAVIFAVGCGSGLIVGWFGGAANNFADILGDFDFGPAEITITHDSPTTAVIGEPFIVTLSVADLSSNPRKIQDIDWSGTMVENMKFGPMTPSPRSSTTESDYREFVFDQSVGADQSVDFTFELTPLQPGVHTATITVYVDDYNSEWIELLIEVDEVSEDRNNRSEPDPSNDSPVKSES